MSLKQDMDIINKEDAPVTLHSLIAIYSNQLSINISNKILINKKAVLSEVDKFYTFFINHCAKSGYDLNTPLEIKKNDV